VQRSLTMSSEVRAARNAGHPAYGLARKYMWWAAGSAVASGALMAISPISAVSVLGLGVWFGWIGWGIQNRMPNITLLNRAYERITRGDNEGARELLLGVDQKRMNHSTRRALAMHRATLALLAGDAKEASALASLAISGKLGVFTRPHEMMQIASAIAARAVARAVSGDHEGARVDARAAREHPGTIPSSLARASLAEAIVLAAGSEKPALRDLFARDGRLMRDYLLPRERVLARALARLARAEKKSVYREPARPTDQVDPIAEWVATMAPEAAAHIDRTRNEPTRAWEPVQPSAVAIKAVESVRKKKSKNKSSGVKVLVLWALLIVMFLAIYMLLQPAAAPAPSVPESASLVPHLFGPILVAMMAVLTAFGFRMNNRRAAALRKAALSDARGDRPAARAIYESLANARAPIVEADLELANIAEREGRFQDALALCERGLSRLSSATSKAIAHDVLAPALSAERAFCLSALGHADEANAELATLANHPSYPFAAMAQLRVRLAQALTAGDLGSALAIARRRSPSAPMHARDEMLCDLLEATEGEGVDEEEWARLDAELRDDPELAGCAERFLPGVRARLVPARTRIASALGEDRLEDEVEDDGGHEREHGSPKALKHT
jgi:hypothetical protein